jgi:hypothetical protein
MPQNDRSVSERMIVAINMNQPSKWADRLRMMIAVNRPDAMSLGAE